MRATQYQEKSRQSRKIIYIGGEEIKHYFPLYENALQVFCELNDSLEWAVYPIQDNLYYYSQSYEEVDKLVG